MSDSSSASGDSRGTPSSSVSSRSFYKGKSKFERDVEAAQRKGVSECKILSHWEIKRIRDPSGGNSWTDAGIKSYREILTMMSPGPAKCSCQRDACRWAWGRHAGWNHTGMWQTEYVPNGLERKGIGEASTSLGCKRIYSLRYTLTDHQFKVLSARFPDWYFVVSEGGSHDHPIAHTSTKIASQRLMDGLPRGTAAQPKVYIDLNGNPSANEAYMRRNPGVCIFSVVELITPKDYVRKNTKWGPSYDADGNARWLEMGVRDIPRDFGPDFGSIVDGFISIHTTYYYDPQEVIALLNWAPNANYYSLMHRFDGYTGTINGGEQRWIKTERSTQSVLTQVNVLSGEQYQHPDNSWWFTSDSYVSNDSAMGWTINLACDESYLIVATACPRVQAMMSSNCLQVQPLFPKPEHCTGGAQTQDQIASSLTVVLSLYGAISVMPIAPQLVDYFGDLRQSVVGKARTAKQYQDHISRARVKANSLMTDKGVRIDAQQLADIARYSFFIDFQDNYGNDKTLFSTGYATTLMADPLYKHGAGALTKGTLSMLCDMLTHAAEAKDIKTGLVKAVRAGVQHANRAGVLHTL